MIQCLICISYNTMYIGMDKVSHRHAHTFDYKAPVCVCVCTRILYVTVHAEM